MSKYEGMNGNGLVMKKDLAALKKALIEAHNREIAGLKPKQLRENGLKKASSRTTSFPILERYKDESCVEYYVIGSVALFPETGQFRFSISENNHVMDNADESRVFQALMRFMNQLPDKGKKYGAETYYWSEYDEDGHGNKGLGTYSYYGSWKPAKRFGW